jgi:aspartate aminotransferase
MPALSARLARIPISATVQMSIRTRALQATGATILSLALGEPDFATPLHAIAAAHQAALRGETKYPPNDGTATLKQAVQRKFRRDSALEYARDEIAVCNGGKQVIYNALMATLDPGDEVIIPAPYFGAYPLIVDTAGGVPVVVDCPETNGFRLEADALAAAITPRTKWVMLNFPNNPSGAACSRADLAAIAIYEHLLYDGVECPTMAAGAPNLRDRVLTVSGVSKSYAMTGWRIGFCGGPRALIAGIVNMQSQATSGACSIAQAAAAAALDGPQDDLARQREIYRTRRDLVVDALRQVPGMRCHRPEGAFYVFPNIADWLGRITAAGTRLSSDEDAVMALLTEQQVACVHGAAFGMSPYLRISYATDTATLTEACRRINAFAHALH